MASPPPTPREVAKMDLMGLMECADKLEIEGVEDFRTDEEYRDAIFRHLPSVAHFKASPSPPIPQVSVIVLLV